MPKAADMTEDTSGVIIDDPVVPPARPADQPLEAPVVHNFKPSQSTGSALDQIASDLGKQTGDTALPPKTEIDLDAAAEAAAEKAEAARAAKEAAAKKTADDAAAKTKTAEQIASDKAAKEASDKAAADKAKADAGKTAEQLAAEKAAADKLAAEQAAAAEPKDALAEVKLPPYVKPPTVNAFSEVKRIARETIAKLEKQVRDAEAKVPKNGGLTAETEKELTELRNFRKVYDFKSDTEFQKNYVKPVADNNESIFTKLEGAGFTKEQIGQIKVIGTDKLDWTPVLEKLQPPVRRAIEAKLLDNENIADKRAAAEKAAEGAPAEFEKKQKDAADKARAEDNALRETTANAILSQVPWFKVKDIPLTATPDEKKRLEADNAFVAEQQGRLKDIMGDQSPGMFGTLAASTLLAYQFKREAIDYKARAEAAETELAKIKKASKPNARPSSAPNDGKIGKPEVNIFKTNAGDALDALAAEKRAARE